MLDETTFRALAGKLAASHASSEWVDLAPGSALLLPHWLGPSDQAGLMQACLELLAWDSPEIRMFGRSHPIPRRHAFVADPGITYRWSGLEQVGQPWIEPLARARSRLRSSGFDFNSVLANDYRGGADSMGWHADDERELGPHPVIATLSLGASRRLAFKRRDGGGRVALELGQGALLLTSGAVQRHWLHQVAKSRRPLGRRVSLTFRHLAG
ncbi:alpha-ketoglutarate-dependent dioxygenase AlkB family protein [Microbulbifer sediminum]|uniref:alpha-ketoglutarate-dependent dioxygenase AlkB family protein n=1 Tax=Microbulbifer sediminum TaxID=2904250 RepID=UPI001F45CC26|nr:alpha-ketoglutarate-dependent dioxygenase AlkB [Microbulbifer sediminum]